MSDLLDALDAPIYTVDTALLNGVVVLRPAPWGRSLPQIDARTPSSTR